MFLDIYYNESNYGTYNVKCANIFGLKCAIYLSEILDIYQKAHKKNKLDEEEYFRLNRDYIKERTTLDRTEQAELDEILSSVKVLYLKDKDHLKIDVNHLTSILTSKDEELLKSISNECKYQSKEHKRESKNKALIENLKAGLSCDNSELLGALRNWVDSVCERNFMNKATVKAFQDVLYQYTKGDLDIALEIVDIATKKGYKECQWAINVYERIHPQRTNSTSQITTMNTVDKKNTF